MVEVRIAQKSDAPGILDIYKPYIDHSAITFETETPEIEQFEQRINKCLQRFPWLVCVIDDVVAGYVYASAHRDRDAYQWTCECSVYIHDQFKGKGIASALYKILFDILKIQGLRTVYAGITLPNEASIQLHERFGFKHFATYENVGYKTDGWKTVGWWRLQINDYELNPAPPFKFSVMNREQFTEMFQKTANRISSHIVG